MQKLSELEPGKHLKVLVYGESGAGKTVFSLGFPKPIWVADFDGKISSGASFYKGCPWLDKVEYENYQKHGKDDLPARRFNSDMDKIAANIGKYKTIVLDSLTTYTDQAMPYLINMNPGVKRQKIHNADIPCQQDYGIFKVFTRDLITRILALPVNVVMTAHIDTKRDDTTGKLIRRPLMAGSLQDSLPVYFEEVYRAYKDDKGYHLQTQPDNTYGTCRTQIKGIPGTVETDYQNLVKKY